MLLLRFYIGSRREESDRRNTGVVSYDLRESV